MGVVCDNSRVSAFCVCNEAVSVCVALSSVGILLSLSPLDGDGSTLSDYFSFILNFQFDDFN